MVHYPALLVAAAVSVSALSDPSGKFTFTATTSASGVATVCVSGKVPQDSWIGLGITATPGAMAGADLNILTTGLSYLHGKGMIMDQLSFGQDAASTAQPFAMLNSAKSSYTGGVLTGCFDRAVKAPSDSTFKDLVAGTQDLIFASGSTVSGTPQKHSISGSVSGNLFAAAVPATTTKSSAESFISLVGVFVAALMA
ncbi:hypothetical protein HDU99_000416 [Rhizoclosmatium hyalinum]|nr:hypothetical protein HDU99_000416 [Rhizoclosmatium hyalinum]